MESTQWIVFSCRACRGVLKISPGMTGMNVVCPTCRTKISVPDLPPVTEKEIAAAHARGTEGPEPSYSSTLPSARSDAIAAQRGESQENWERKGRTVGDPMDFKSKLQTTAAPELQPDAENPTMVRVNMRRRKIEATHSDFDDPEAPHVKQRRRRTKMRVKGQSIADSMTKGLIFAVIILALLAGYLGWRQWQTPSNRPDVSSVPPAPKLEERAAIEYGPELWETVKKFAAAPTVDEMLMFIREPERVTPKVRAYYTPANPWQPLELTGTFDPSALQSHGEFAVIALHLANFEQIPISLERTSMGFKVDWESFVGYGDMSWGEFMEKRPQQPKVMRVSMKHGASTDYFDGQFDAGRYRCFQLSDRKLEHVLYGYTRITSAVDVAIQKAIVQPSPGPNFLETLAVLKLRYPADAKGNRQVEIVEFLEKGWVFREPDTPASAGPGLLPGGIEAAAKPAEKREAQPAPKAGP